MSDAGAMQSSKRISFHDIALFIRTWFCAPRNVGAVLPSSTLLAQLITSEITCASAPVIELGSGTGVFTRALVDRGIREDRLALIESDPGFAQVLKSRFPTAEVLIADAARLRRLRLFGGEPAGAVVSGLPLLSMSVRRTFAILNTSFRSLRPDGAFYQFTYGPRCPIPRRVLDRLDLEAKYLGAVRANLPPAAVYRFRRRLCKEVCIPSRNTKVVAGVECSCPVLQEQRGGTD